MIYDELSDEMKAALKAGDKTRLSVIRMLRSELKNAQIAAGEELSEEAERRVLMSYAKKRKEAGQQYADMGRRDLADKEKTEYDITMSFLPQQLSEEELTVIIKRKIEESGASGMKDMGRVIKMVMEEATGRAEGSVVSALVKKILSG